MRFITIAMLVIACGAGTWARAQPAPESESVTVEGILIVGEFFGPPNYGESPSTDEIERSYVLQLPAPLTTQQPNLSQNVVLQGHEMESHFVQLVGFGNLQDSAKKLRGKKVKVVGTLSEASTGHHRTPVLIDVRSIDEVSKWEW
jgi:hypothetical protein